MSDDTLKNMPEPYVIPRQTIERWLENPPDEYIDARLTRADYDNLYSAINKLADSQAEFQGSMIAYTNGNNDDANRLMQISQASLMESTNALRRAFAAIMSTKVDSNDR